MICFSLAGCSLVKLRDESKAFYSFTVLVGRVSSAPAWDRPVVVVAYSKKQHSIEISHYTVLHEPGAFELIVPKGDYYLFAFGDANRNLKPEAGEPAGQYGSPTSITASGDGVISDLDFVLSNSGATPLGIAVGAAIAKERPKRWHSTQVGSIANLDLEIFSDASGKKGYWTPMEFYREVGGNIYFLEEYDPSKIPILFVHGATGSPQNWRYFFEHLDRKRYQPWFFFYPSGASVESMSHLLFWKLLNLQIKYHFSKIFITGHSMGGLVVRSFLATHGSHFPQVKLFISISTPWGGEQLADLGVKHFPAVIPSWKDMQPDGRFMRSLFQKKLPPGIDYYLFFGHKGSHSLIRPNNDGTITLASQLKMPAQAEAKMIYGFNEDHTRILSSEEVFAQYNVVLNAAEKKSGDGKLTGEGNLRVHFSYGHPDEGPKSQLLLLLTPGDKERGKVVLPLSPDDAGREFGPFPAGSYEVSLLEYAFRADPLKIPVTIGAGRTPALRFALTPQGVLSGYVGVKPAPSANPAGSYRPPHEDLRILSITLTGEGEKRSLSPLREEVGDFIERYRSGKDFASNSFFSFFGLPEGEYELTITAEGCQPYKAAYRVVPGKYGYYKPIDMIPLKQPLKKDSGGRDGQERIRLRE